MGVPHKLFILAYRSTNCLVGIDEKVKKTYKRKREFFFNLTTHSTHFIYDYMASDIWLRTILIVRKETRSRHIGYSYRLTAIVLLYAPSHRQDSTYHGLCYTSRGALVGTRYSSMGKKTYKDNNNYILFFVFRLPMYACLMCLCSS